MKLMVRTTIACAVATALAVYFFTPTVASASTGAGSPTAVLEASVSEDGQVGQGGDQAATQVEQTGDQGATQAEQGGDQGQSGDLSTSGDGAKDQGGDQGQSGQTGA